MLTEKQNSSSTVDAAYVSCTDFNWNKCLFSFFYKIEFANWKTWNINVRLKHGRRNPGISPLQSLLYSKYYLLVMNYVNHKYVQVFSTEILKMLLSWVIELKE